MRRIVEAYQPRYELADKQEKNMITKEVLHIIVHGGEQTARFLKQKGVQKWCEASLKEAHKKVGHRLREDKQHIHTLNMFRTQMKRHTKICNLKHNKLNVQHPTQVNEPDASPKMARRFLRLPGSVATPNPGIAEHSKAAESPPHYITEIAADNGSVYIKDEDGFICDAFCLEGILPGINQNQGPQTRSRSLDETDMQDGVHVEPLDPYEIEGDQISPEDTEYLLAKLGFPQRIDPLPLLDLAPAELGVVEDDDNLFQEFYNLFVGEDELRTLPFDSIAQSSMLLE